MSNGVSEEKRIKTDDNDDCKIVGEVDYTEFLEEIDDCQTQVDELNEQAAEEILMTEMKYNKLRKPHFSKRSEAIAKIPQFWLKTFMNNPTLTEIIPEEQQNCLKYLSNFYVEECEDIKNGYKIIFKFDTNPYFENETLVKEYFPNSDDTPKPLASPIKWKPGKNLVPIENPAKDPKKRGRDLSTFFHWLTSHHQFNEDDISEALKDEIWASPLQFFMLPEVESEDGEEANSDSEDSDEEANQNEMDGESSEDGEAKPLENGI